MPITQANAMRYVVGKTNTPIEELLKYKYCRFYRYVISESEQSLNYYGVRVEVCNDRIPTEATICIFDLLFNHAETADNCYSYLTSGRIGRESTPTIMFSGHISSDQDYIFTELKKSWSSMATVAQNGHQWFNSEKWYFTTIIVDRDLMVETPISVFYLNECISTLGPLEPIKEEIFMDLIDEDKQQNKTDIVTDKKKEPEQKFLPLDEFMKLRYKEIYGRRPEPSDTGKVITDVKALTNTQILNGDYEWWELTQVAPRIYNVPLLTFTITDSQDGAVNIDVLSSSAVKQLVSLYGPEKVLGVSTLAHRLNIIASR